MKKSVLSILSILIVWTAFSCDDSPTKAKPEDLDITFELSTTTAKPGELVTFTPSKDLESLGDIALYFNDNTAPLFKTEASNYTAMVPLVNPGSYKIYLKNSSNGAVSQSIDFTVTQLPATNVPPGKILTDLVSLNTNTIAVMQQAFVPVLKNAHILNEANSQLIDNEFSRLNGALEKLQTEINNLPEDQKKLLDELLNSAGVAELLANQNQMLKKISALQNTQNTYYLHSLLVGLDGFSAIITAVKEVTGMVSLVAAMVSGGSSMVISVPVMIILSDIDNIIDGCLPTDLSEISIENDPLKIPINGQGNIIFKGKFVTQSNPINASINIVLDALLSGIKVPGIKEHLIEKIGELLLKIGLSATDRLTGLTENWQQIYPVYTEIDPSFYDKGINSFKALMQGKFNFSVPLTKPFEFISLLSGTDYQIENTSIAELGPYCSVIEGKSAGTTNLIYGGYCFREAEGSFFENILGKLFGIELPEKLKDDQLEAAPIRVESMAANTIQITSDPQGADIYLDGTKMNETTPTVLENVLAGEHHIRLFKQGYNEYNTCFSMAENGTIIINANLGEPLPPLPVFVIEHPSNNQHFTDNVISINGRIYLEDPFGNQTAFTGDKAILSLNGVEKEIVVSYGSFSENTSITSGANTIQIRANSPNGDTGASEELTVYGDFSEPDIEITLTWNTPTSDIDLHVWNPNGEHSYYSHKVISDGSLDVDKTYGYGPETFTAQNALNGAYVVKVNSYTLNSDSYSDATVQVKLKNGNTLTFGPHRFTVSDRNGNNPNAWWDVYTFTVSDNQIFKQNALPESLVEKIKNDMQHLAKKPNRGNK